MKITDEIAHEGAAKLGSKLCPSGVLSFSSCSLAFFLAPSPLSLSSIRALRISAMATVVQSLAGVTGVGSHAAVSGRGCCRASASSSATPAAPGGAPLIRLISTTSSSGSSSFATPSPNFASRPLPRHSCCEVVTSFWRISVLFVKAMFCIAENGLGARADGLVVDVFCLHRPFPNLFPGLPWRK